MIGQNRGVSRTEGTVAKSNDETPSIRGRGTAGGEKMAVHRGTFEPDRRAKRTANPMLGIYRGVQISMIFWGGLAAVLLVVW